MEMKKELANFLDWAKEYTNNKLDYSSSYLSQQYLKVSNESFLMFGKNEVELSKHKSIDEQVEILKDTLEEMMTGFDTEENRIDFILDICNGYRKRISK